MCGCDTKTHSLTGSSAPVSNHYEQRFCLLDQQLRREAESLASCQSPFHPELLALWLLVPPEQTTRWLP